MYLGSIASFKKFFRVATPALGLELANGIPFLLNFLFVGSFGDPVPIAVFGLCNFFNNVLVFPVGFSMIEVAGVTFAKRYGERNFREMAKDVGRTLIVLGVFLFIYNVLCVYSLALFVASGVELPIAERTAHMIRYIGPVCSLMFINKCIQAFLMAQEVVDEFLYPNLLSIVLGVGLARIFIVDFAWQEMGFVPSKLIQELLCFGFGSYYLWKKANREALQIPPLADILSGFGVYLHKLFFSAAGTVAEWATFEVNTFMAVQMQDLDQLAVFLDWTGISPLFYMIGIGFSGTIRVIIGNMMGEGDLLGAKKELQAHFVYITLVSFMFTILFLVFGMDLAHLYVNNEVIAEGLYRAIIAIALFNWGYTMFYPAFQAFRLIDEEKYFLLILLTVFIETSTIVSWLLAYPFGLKAVGLTIGHGLATNCIQLFLCRKIFFVHDWGKDVGMIRERLGSFREEPAGVITGELKTEMIHYEDKKNEKIN